MLPQLGFSKRHRFRDEQPEATPRRDAFRVQPIECSSSNGVETDGWRAKSAFEDYLGWR